VLCRLSTYAEEEWGRAWHMAHADRDLTILGRRAEELHSSRLIITRGDRRKHLYVLGKSGTGKSALLAQMAKADLLRGEGLCFIDAHGRESDGLLQAVPTWRKRQVIHWAPGLDKRYPIGWNLIQALPEDDRDLAIASVYDVFEHLYSDFWGPQTGNILRKVLRALFDIAAIPNIRPPTLLDAYALLVSKRHREWVANLLRDPITRAYWEHEFNAWSERERTQHIAPLQNKLGMFMDPPLRYVVGQVKSAFDPRWVIDNRKILILNLAGLGEEEKNVFASLVITALYTAALRRNPEQHGPDFGIYIDEAQKFLTKSITAGLTEARKFNLHFICATQSVGGSNWRARETLRTMIDNAGTHIVFRVGAETAKHMHEEFATRKKKVEDFIDLQPFEFLVRSPRSVDPESGWTYPPVGTNYGNRARIIRYSKERYGTSVKRVNRKLRRHP